MKQKVFLLLCFFSFAYADAQSDFCLYSLRSLQQSTTLNPAFMPAYDLSVGIPGISNTMVATQLSGLDLHSVMKSLDAEGLVNLNQLYASINNNLIGVKVFVQTDFFYVRMQFGHYQVGIFSGLKTNSFALLSKEFIDFGANGNGKYEGQTMHFTQNNIQSSAYVETGVGVAREFERFTVGARVKMLDGIANISTNDLSLNYSTGAHSYDPTRVTLGGTLNSSGLPFLQDTLNGQPTPDRDKNFHPVNENLTPNINIFNNFGVAVDLGATYNVTPRLNIQASALDLGGITWKEHPYNYNLNNADITYLGLNYNQFLQVSDSTTRGRFVDSLNNFIKTSTTSNSYYTPLVSRFIIGANYDLTFRDRVGLIIQVQYFAGSFLPAYTLNYSRKVGTNWDITTHYSYYNNSFSNLGLGTSIKWGAAQIYFITDDILVYFNQSYARAVYFRFGCNLVWGPQRARPRF